MKFQLTIAEIIKTITECWIQIYTCKLYELLLVRFCHWTESCRCSWACHPVDTNLVGDGIIPWYKFDNEPIFGDAVHLSTNTNILILVCVDQSQTNHYFWWSLKDRIEGDVLVLSVTSKALVSRNCTILRLFIPTLTWKKNIKVL